MLNMIHTLFYGDYWYIAWAVIIIPIITCIVIDIIHIIKRKQQK